MSDQDQDQEQDQDERLGTGHVDKRKGLLVGTVDNTLRVGEGKGMKFSRV